MSAAARAADDDDGTATVLERDVALGGSRLWAMQRRYFAEAGPSAWASGTVPHFVTSSAAIAAAYARVVVGFLRDCRAAGAPLYDPSEPIYIVELGAGAGRFAWRFLRKLRALTERLPLGEVRFCYVMTDYSARNVAAWRAHPQLQPFFADGTLEVATLDVERMDADAIVLGSGRVLTPTTTANPLVVIANYLFDSVPSDVFAVAGGRLAELRLTLSVPRPVADDAADDPSLLPEVTATWAAQPAPPEPYREPALDRILAGYRERLADGCFLFPVAALRALDRLRRLARDRLLLLSSDKGAVWERELLAGRPPEIVVHGSFSLMVNYHAIGEWFRHHGGEAWAPARRRGSLATCGFLLGLIDAGCAETRQAFEDAVNAWGPDDFYTLKHGIEQVVEALTLPQLVAYLRLSGWDARIFHACFVTLAARIDGADAEQQAELRDALLQVWEDHFAIGDERRLAFELGVLLGKLGSFDEALHLFERASAEGVDADTAYNIGLCHYRCGRLEPALRHFEAALALEPDFDRARAMRVIAAGDLQRLAPARRPATP